MSDSATDFAEYWACIDAMAKEAREAEKRGEDVGDFVHESVDGSEYVIYTHRNVQVLALSDSESAAFEELGKDALVGCNSYGEVVARLAYWAMRADVEHAIAELEDEEALSEMGDEEGVA